MSDLAIVTHPDGVLVIDSRLIAQELVIKHENFLETISKYKMEAEQAFGGLRFETGVPDKPTGNPPRFVLLTEEQATFFMTLSRNTPEVVALKVRLVKAFFDAKQKLLGQGFAQPPTTTIYIQRLQNMSDHNVPDDLWTTFREGAEVLLLVEKDYRVPVSQMDLCDGSIGSHWRQYREEVGLITPIGSYTHNFRDQRGSRECNAYQYSDLPTFRKWIREVYNPTHLPKYLAEKYGKRAVLQIFQELGLLNDYILQITEEKRSSPKQEERYQIFLAARDAISGRFISS